MRKIELPSGEMVEELQRHLQEKRFPGATSDKGRRTLQFPDSMGQSEWANVRAEVEKWAKGRRLEVVESLRVQYPKTEPAKPEVDPRTLKEEAKKKVDRLTPQTAEDRYRYLSSKPISELTDAEIQERLELAQRPLDKDKASK